MREAPLNEGAFLVSAIPPQECHRGRGTGDGGGYAHRGLWRSYPWAVEFLFGNTELSLELWTVIAGISGFDD